MTDGCAIRSKAGLARTGSLAGALGFQYAPVAGAGLVLELGEVGQAGVAAQVTGAKTPPYIETDSCDEYPFAGTYESGAMQTGFDGQPKPFVTTGADCWQGTAAQNGSSGIEPADWNVMLLDSTSTTQCVRAHIPKKLNTTLGGAYGNFVLKQRLLDKDAFWVFATP
jgi:hypothetical protein